MNNHLRDIPSQGNIGFGGRKKSNLNSQTNEKSNNSDSSHGNDSFIKSSNTGKHIQFGTIEQKTVPSANQQEKQMQNENNRDSSGTTVKKNPVVTEPALENNLEGYVVQFCGSAAPGQGFYYIEDTPCDQEGKDVSTLAMITVVKGEVTAKQIETEFKTLTGEESPWRWYAKKIADQKFQTRFPIAKALLKASHFRSMSLRSVPSAVIKVDNWSAEIGAKGKLQEAWFRIKNLPMEKDQFLMSAGWHR